MKKILLSLSVIVLSAIVLSGCGSSGTDGGTQENEKTKVTFWTSDNPPQLKYWENMARKFEKNNDKIEIEVTQTKGSPTFEATVQAAVASNSMPTISENINRGFGSQLGDNEAIVDLKEFPEFDEIVKNRNMTETAQQWQFSDGKQYILPLYTNTVLCTWNLDLLSDLGINKVPETYSEALEAGRKLKKKYPDKNLIVNPNMSDLTGWQRWFDFFPLYNAASDGVPFVEGSSITADDSAVNETLNFVSEMKKENLLVTAQATDPFPNGESLLNIGSLFDFPTWESKYPDFKYGKQWIVSNMLVPDNKKSNSDAYTFADSKGIVMFEKATDKEKQAAMEFLKFVFSDEQHDVDWIETTSMIPARDSFDDDNFSVIIKENPELQLFFTSTSKSVPGMDNANWSEFQQSFGDKVWSDSINNKGDNKENWKEFKKEGEDVLE